MPPDGWQPSGWIPTSLPAGALRSIGSVSAANAIRTPQFWLLWVVLCFNVTAGDRHPGERAAPIYSDFFPGGSGLAAAAAGFVAILSLANMLGRVV